MSRLGKKSIAVPQGVTIVVSGQEVAVRGPKGELKRTFPPGFSIRVEGNAAYLAPPEKTEKRTSALWGTYWKHLANMVEGVERGFSKTLEFEGIGYRAEVVGNELVLSVGFTHPVRLLIPAGLAVTVEKNKITVQGTDREAVGQFAARIKSIRPPEPYKGTGIKYQGERIRRKAGKKLAGTAG